MVEVESHVNLPDGTSIPVSALPEDGAAAAALVGDFGGAAGYLTIRDGASGPVVLADVLRVLIPTVCLQGLTALVRAGRLRVESFDHDESVTLTVDGDRVTLTGDQIGVTTLPLAGYVAAQKACGAQYVALARRVWQGDPGRADALAHLEAGLAEVVSL